MKFKEFFGFNNEDGRLDKGRNNDGGSHQAIPNQPPEEFSHEDIDMVDVSKEIERIEAEISEEETSLNPDIGRLEFLRNKLDILKTQQ